MENKIYSLLMGGGIHDEENHTLLELVKQLDVLKKDNDDKNEIINNLQLTQKQQQEEIEHLKTELKKPRKRAPTKSLESYDIVNLNKFLKTEDYKLINPEIYEYDDEITAFDRHSKVDNYFRDYQRKFILDWSLSTQELVILYYGVGSGKTMIAVNCAEQYIALNSDGHVYFLVPSSLVLPTIKEMFLRGINPMRKDKNGDYIYYFLSYQQLLRSQFDFKDNSLLILDEAHNLRNLRTKGLTEKVSARKVRQLQEYSLIGNKLAEKLIFSSSKFLRSIFMTGTLFVNNPGDIETIISIGYKKAPMLNYEISKYKFIHNDPQQFALYYDGLISFYRIPSDAPQFPKKMFHFIPIESKNIEYKKGEDPYFINSRTDAAEVKIEWIIDFIKRNKNQKTLIYSQFITKSINILTKYLDKLNITYGVINGAYNMIKKLEIVHMYNTNQIKILIFTLSIKEGISFLETNNFIAIDPYWNYAIFEQILARGIRLNSHKLGSKTNINLYFLVGIPEESKETEEWFKTSASIFNNDIKTFLYKKKTTEKGEEVKDDIIHKKFISRDIDMYNRMFRKQEEINGFESKLLECKSFEESNNIENNEFIEIYNMEILKHENSGKIYTNKQKIKLKKDMYNEFYKKSIEQIKNKFVRFNDDTRYKANRNPDLEEIANNTEYKNASDKIRHLLNNNATLDDIFEAFKIDKIQITKFQANFTPKNHVDDLIELSGIKHDKRDKLYILEPTAGIGGIISELIKLPNHANFLVDCNEIHNLFYQIGEVMFDTISNVKWYNFDYYNYKQKYNYDYILGNPPFNLRTQINKVNRKHLHKPETITKIDFVLYDIDFVAKAYDDLNVGGILCFIISDRYLRQKNGRFKKFFDILEEMKKSDSSLVNVSKVETSFRQDKNITKKMETSFGMVFIRLVKVLNFSINLYKGDKETEKYQDEDEKDEYDELEEMNTKIKKTIKMKPKNEVVETPPKRRLKIRL